MRFVQLAHAVTENDAASRHVINVDAMLKELGYETAIFAPKFDAIYDKVVKNIDCFDATKDDIVIYQMTTGTSFNNFVAKLPYKIVLYYHNITPASFFFGNAWGSWWKCIKGRRQLKKVAKNSFFAWGASEYSRGELTELGLTKTAVMSQIVEPERITCYDDVPAIYEKYKDGATNLIMVGRVVPHKKQDEAIAMIAEWKKAGAGKVRLIIIGGTKASYEKKLRKQAKELNVEDSVVFAGKVSNEELCTYYRLADALICLSEHEGFCVPLVEAMAFSLPVFAYACAAVPETLGKAGVLTEDKSPAELAKLVKGTLTDTLKLKELKKEQEKRLFELSRENILVSFKRDIEEIIALKREQK